MSTVIDRLPLCAEVRPIDDEWIEVEEYCVFYLLTDDHIIPRAACGVCEFKQERKNKNDTGTGKGSIPPER
jgi:hypothetical protein